MLEVGRSRFGFGFGLRRMEDDDEFMEELVMLLLFAMGVWNVSKIGLGLIPVPTTRNTNGCGWECTTIETESTGSYRPMVRIVTANGVGGGGVGNGG